jgi:hypothetical protein
MALDAIIWILKRRDSQDPQDPQDERFSRASRGKILKRKNLLKNATLLYADMGAKEIWFETCFET